MDQMANCGGWLMTAGSILILTVLILGGAAAAKYLFFAERRNTQDLRKA